MEKERINQKNASRIIQQKQNLGTNTIVDNRPYSSFPFFSNPTAQRVSEEDEETMQGKFDSSVQRMEDEDEETLQGKFESPVQRASEEDEDTLQGKFDKPIQKKNETGMPDNLKAGIESLSGFSMDDVRVHYNSRKPATVQALAYTQGTDIHVAPGQEKHLAHEAWHVAQQMAGRVSPTTNINGMPVNDNAALEHEADVMGEKAVQMKSFGKEHMHGAKNHSVIQNYIGQSHNLKNAVMQRVKIRVDGGGDVKFIKLIYEALLSIKNEFYVKKILESPYLDTNGIPDANASKSDYKMNNDQNLSNWGDLLITKGDECAFMSGSINESEQELVLMMNINQVEKLYFDESDGIRKKISEIKNESSEENGNQTIASVLLHELGHAYQHYLGIKNNEKTISGIDDELNRNVKQYPLFYEALINSDRNQDQLKNALISFGIFDIVFFNSLLLHDSKAINKMIKLFEYIQPEILEKLGTNNFVEADNLFMNEIPYNSHHNLGIRTRYQNSIMLNNEGSIIAQMTRDLFLVDYFVRTCIPKHLTNDAFSNIVFSNRINNIPGPVLENTNSNMNGVINKMLEKYGDSKKFIPSGNVFEQSRQLYTKYSYLLRSR